MQTHYTRAEVETNTPEITHERNTNYLLKSVSLAITDDGLMCVHIHGDAPLKAVEHVDRSPLLGAREGDCAVTVREGLFERMTVPSVARKTKRIVVPTDVLSGVEESKSPTDCLDARVVPSLFKIPGKPINPFDHRPFAPNAHDRIAPDGRKNLAEEELMADFVFETVITTHLLGIMCCVVGTTYIYDLSTKMI